MDALKERFISAKSKEERQAVEEEIHRICDEDPAAVAEIMKLQLQETHRKINEFIGL